MMDDLLFRLAQTGTLASRSQGSIVTRMSNRFYINCDLAPGVIELLGPEAHHLGVVCRLRPGDLVSLFNGDGHEYPARVAVVSRKQVELQVLAVESPNRELPMRLEVAAPLPRGDRAQFLIEKLTELGVSSFVPLQTSRSVVHPGAGKLEKLQRYVVEASKQCGRNVLLRVEPETDWETYCKRQTLPMTKVMAHPGEGSNSEFDRGAAALAVGPEGGFTNQEVEAARQLDWQFVGLGPRILRIETAAILLSGWAICRNL